jgi:parvulin-like peptidyl-prolyl isomerase
VDQSLAQWKNHMGREATSDEKKSLLEQLVREEVYFRQAKELGLDTNDTIVRRRLVQKLQFILDVDQPPPDEETLRAFYQEHTTRYQKQLSLSFKHRYFSKDSREDAQQDAQDALNSEEGFSDDPFMLQKSYTGRSQAEIRALYGNNFAQQIALAKVGTWELIQSAFGWHLVLVASRTEPRSLSFEEATAQINRDWKTSEQIRVREENYQNLKANFDIVLP